LVELVAPASVRAQRKPEAAVTKFRRRTLRLATGFSQRENHHHCL
jgi:hypothetical protein